MGTLELTERQREVVTLAAASRPRKVIAAALGISEKMVDWHFTEISHKLGFTCDVATATRIALLNEWIPLRLKYQ